MTEQEWAEHQARVHAQRFREARKRAEECTARAFPVGHLVRIQNQTMPIVGRVHAMVGLDPSEVACVLEHGHVRSFSVDEIRAVPTA